MRLSSTCAARTILLALLLAAAACGDDAVHVLTPTPPLPDAAPPPVDAGAWLDPSFGTGGYVVPHGLNEAEIGGAARAPDGTVYFGGQSGSFDDLHDPVRPFVCRVGADGLDPAFGSDGCVTDLEAPGTAWLWDLFAGDDGVVLAGNALDAVEDRFQGTLWQLDAGGARAVDFGEDGEARVDEPPSGSVFTGLVYDGAGGFIALVDHYVIDRSLVTDDERVARVDASGAVEILPSFLAAGDRLGKLLRAPDGALLLAGVTSAEPSGLTLWRLAADLQPDPTFGVGGKILLPARGALYLDPTPPGSLLLLTSLVGPTRWGAEVRRLSLDGVLDPGFGTGGVARLETANGDLAVLPDGRIATVAVVGVGAGLEVTVLLPDGRPDLGISPSGSIRFVAPMFSGNNYSPMRAIADAEGRLLVFRAGDQGQVDPIDPSPIVFVTRVVIPPR